MWADACGIGRRDLSDAGSLLRSVMEGRIMLSRIVHIELREIYALGSWLGWCRNAPVCPELLPSAVICAHGTRAGDRVPKQGYSSRHIILRGKQGSHVKCACPIPRIPDARTRL